MAQSIKKSTHVPPIVADLNDYVNRSEASLHLLESADLSMVLRTKLVQTWRFTLSKLKHLKRKASAGLLTEELDQLQRAILPDMLKGQAETALIILRASNSQEETIKSWEKLWSDLLGAARGDQRP